MELILKKEYRDKNGAVSREDGPAMEWSNGVKFWLIHGKRHREDGPAMEWKDGTKEWWSGGNRHREDGPAIEMANGRKSWWWKNELIMKTDGDFTEAQIKEFRLRKMN